MSLKLLRVMAGLTQEELAKALDVVPSTISNWETGKTKPCKKHRNRLRAALHVTDEQLRKELECTIYSNSPAPSSAISAP